MRWKVIIAMIAMLCLIPSVLGSHAGTIIKPTGQELVDGVTKIEWTEFDKAVEYNVSLLDDSFNYVYTITPNETELFTYYDFNGLDDGDYYIKVESIGPETHIDTKHITLRDPGNMIHIGILAAIIIAGLFMVYIYAVNDKIIIFGIFAGMLFILVSSVMFTLPTYHKVCDAVGDAETSFCARYEIMIPGIFKTMGEIMFLIVGLGIIMDAMFSHGEKFRDSQNNI